MQRDRSDEQPRYVITGPTGWIGTAFLTYLARTLGPDWTGRVRLFGSSARRLKLPNGAELEVAKLDDLSQADVHGALIIHLAYLTKEKAELLGTREFLSTNTDIDDRVLDALRGGGALGVFVASSGAAAQAASGVDHHPYGVAKLIQEDRFLSCGLNSGVSVLAGRIFNLSGPHMNKLSSYALSSFLAQALETGRIRVAATTPVYRSYLGVLDLCELVCRTLLEGRPPATALDLCGPLVVEMADVARAAAEATGLTPDVVQRAPINWSSPSIYLGRSTDTLSLAGAIGLRLESFPEQVESTAFDLRARLQGGASSG